MKSQSGNVLLYVLIAVVLFAALSFLLSRQQDSDSVVGSLDEGKARLRAEDLINYGTTMRTAIENMVVMQNVLPTELNFVKPGETGYDTAPHTAKPFHPVGGGITQFSNKDEYFTSGSAKRGWVVQQGTNVAWTQSTQSDVILTFLDVEESVCREINKRLYKSTAIPTTTTVTSVAFVNGGGDDADFTTTDCPTCNQRSSFCIKDSTGVNAFYNVVLAR